jgi:hypothetical protein
MTFDHDFAYSFPLFSSFLKKEGRRKGEWIEKIVIKSHVFMLDLSGLHRIDRAERHYLKSRFLLFILLFFFPLFLWEKRKSLKNNKVVMLSHAFLLDLQVLIA